MPKFILTLFTGWLLLQSVGMIKAYATINAKQEAQAEALCKQYPQACRWECDTLTTGTRGASEPPFLW